MCPQMVHEQMCWSRQIHGALSRMYTDLWRVYWALLQIWPIRGPHVTSRGFSLSGCKGLFCGGIELFGGCVGLFYKSDQLGAHTWRHAVFMSADCIRRKDIIDAQPLALPVSLSHTHTHTFPLSLFLSLSLLLSVSLLKYSLLHLECHFFILKSSSSPGFSSSTCAVLVSPY